MRALIFLLLTASAVSAQRFEVMSGDFKLLKTIQEYNVSFDYKDMEIHGYESEEAFVEKKASKEKDRPEVAKAFVDNWYNDRTTKYEPRFIAYFNDKFPDGEVKVAPDPTLKYTMNVKTVWLYPGYGMGPSGKPSKITAIVTVFETANPSNILLQVKFEKAIGFESHDPNKPGERISGAYEKIAKNVVMQIKKVL